MKKITLLCIAMMMFVACNKEENLSDNNNDPIPAPIVDGIIPDAVTDYDGNSYDAVRLGDQQSALSLPTPEKQNQEIRPLLAVKDFFQRIIVSKTTMRPWVDEFGIRHIGLYDFLLNETLLEPNQ